MFKHGWRRFLFFSSGWPLWLKVSETYKKTRQRTLSYENMQKYALLSSSGSTSNVKRLNYRPWGRVCNESMWWSQGLWCGARVSVVEPECLPRSQTLYFGARVNDVGEPETLLWSHSLQGQVIPGLKFLVCLSVCPSLSWNSTHSM